MKKVLMTLLALTMLTACGGGKSTGSNSDSSAAEGYTFVSKSVEIKMGAKADDVLDDLGSPLQDPTEEKSCAFEGYDRTYIYPGFYLLTGEEEGKDEIVSTVELKDDSVATKEGVSIGDSKSKVEEVYGSDYSDNNGQYVYTKGNTTLSFMFEGDSVSYIAYAQK